MLLDIHGDIWTDVTVKSAQGKRNIIRDYHLERFKKGNMAGGIFVIWADPPHDARPKERLLESIQAMSKELIDSRDLVQVMYSSDDLAKAIAANKLAVLLGLEGLSGIGEDVDALYPLYQLGFRHASLTWNEQNALATGVKGEPSRGLTQKGKEAVSLIHDLGMIMDVSHANDRTFWDIADLSSRPIIASHSNARALCNVPRNLTDEQIKTIGSKNGLIGLNAYNEFIHEVPAERTVDRLIDHLVHVAGLIGIDKIALGFDFFEYLSSSTTDSFTSATYAGTIGLEDITQAPNMISRLSARGFTQEEIELVSYKNFLALMDRVMK
jgi:membrane dipeptidase